MVRPNPTYPKIYKEQPPPLTRAGTASLGSLPEVLRAFRRVTGWSLQYDAGTQETDPIDLTWSPPVNPGVGAPPGLLRLDPVGSAGTPAASQVDPRAVRELASALSGMLGELLQSQHALWQREAELAAGVPLVPQTEPEKHLAARLQAVLQGGAQAVGCQAAALYLLDDATTCLKLRSSWGLPTERLTHPPRPLQGALADLEALLGHAVVVDDRVRVPQWNPPEDFPIAVCVPVATPTTILGTLWLFSNQYCDLNDRKTNLVEVVAGRLAAELGREMLLRVASDAAQFDHQMADAQRLLRGQLPAIPPLLDGWDMAGWTGQAEPVGGQFFDWFSTPKGLLTLAVAQVAGRGLEAALTANAVRAALRAHAQYQHRADRLLNQLNLTLWTGSAGDQSASLFCALVEPHSGQLQFAVAGQTCILLLGHDGWTSLSQSGTPLGGDPEFTYRRCDHRLQPGQALLIAPAKGTASEAHSESFDESQLAKVLIANLGRPAKDLLAAARNRPGPGMQATSPSNRALLVLKRLEA